MRRCEGRTLLRDRRSRLYGISINLRALDAKILAQMNKEARDAAAKAASNTFWRRCVLLSYLIETVSV